MSWTCIVGTALAAGVAWIGLKVLRTRRWGRMLGAARRAELAGDLAGAFQHLEKAEAFAAQRQGPMGRFQVTTTRQALADLAFRMGNLDRSAALVFDLLERQSGSA